MLRHHWKRERALSSQERQSIRWSNKGIECRYLYRCALENANSGGRTKPMPKGSAPRAGEGRKRQKETKRAIQQGEEKLSKEIGARRKNIRSGSLSRIE